MTSSQQQGIVLQEAYFADRQVTTNDNVGYFVLPKGYFTYRSRSDTDVFVFNRNDILDKGIISYYYPVFQTKYTCSDFLLRRLNHGIRKQLAMAAEGTGQKVLAHSKFKNMTVSVPKIGEQQKIGTFFRQLDRLITLHQCNCNMATRPCEWSSGLRAIAWEQRKLGDLAEFNPKAELPTNFEYVDLESVVGTELINHRTQTKCTAPSRAQRLAQYGDLFYQLVRPYQKNNYLFELNSENFVFSTGYAQLRPSVDGYFLMSLVQNEYFVQKVLDNCTGTSYPAINVNDLAEINIYTSLKKSEQARIGTFFRQLDRLVTLHQRKRGRLENIKKAMLEKMFPKNGADVPEVRFAGFTEAWEQRKVGEYYDFKNGLNKGKEYFGIGTPIVNFTDVFHLRGIYEKDLKGKVSLTRAEIANFQVKMGDIFFTRTSETIDEIGFPSVMLDEPKDTVFSGFVLRGRALQDDPLTLQFKRYVFFTDAFRKEMVKKSSITTRALTSGTAIKNMEFVFPKNKKEQEFIGNFFRHLDRLITLHQRKVALLQNIKKACLEKMFV